MSLIPTRQTRRRGLEPDVFPYVSIPAERLRLPTEHSRLVVMVLTAFLVLASARIVLAQSPIATGWSSAVEISDMPSTVGGASVVGDSNGNLYVLWSANSEGKGQDQVDTFYFRRWNGTEWTPSVDILVTTPGGPWLQGDRLILDAYGSLVYLWHKERTMFVSVADPLEAENAGSWRSMPLLEGELTYQSEIVSAPNGTLHALVTGEGQNIYYFRSGDGGNTWRKAQISAGSDSTRQYSWGSLALAPDGSGVLHASWTESREDNKWLPTGVYVTRSSDDGSTWSEPAPVVSAPGHGHSTVIASSGSNVMVFWNRSVGSVDGRYYAFSADGGDTWGEPQVAYERVSGFTRPPYLFIDSLGQLHMIGAGYDALTSVGGEQIWYSQWDSARWTEPKLIIVDGKPMTGNEVFDARLVGGNRLLYTWTDAATKDIWFTSQTLPGPSVPETRLELPVPATVTPSAQTSAAAVATLPEPPPTRAVLTDSDPPASTSLNPVAAGIIPAVILVAAVLTLSIRRRRA